MGMIFTQPETTANMTEINKRPPKYKGIPYSCTEKNTVKMSILPKMRVNATQSKSQKYLCRN